MDGKDIRNLIIVMALCAIAVMLLAWPTIQEKTRGMVKTEVITVARPSIPEYHGFDFKDDYIVPFYENDDELTTEVADAIIINDEDNIHNLSHKYGTSIEKLQSIVALWTMYANEDIVPNGETRDFIDYSANTFNYTYQFYKKKVCGSNSQCSRYISNIAPKNGALIFVKLSIYKDAIDKGLDTVYFKEGITALDSPKFSTIRDKVFQWGGLFSPTFMERSAVKTRYNQNPYTVISKDMATDVHGADLNLFHEFIGILDKVEYNEKFSPGPLGMLHEQDIDFGLPITNNPEVMETLKKRYPVKKANK